MKFMKHYTIIIAACGLLLSSCGSDVSTFGQSTIQFVRSILGDSESPEYRILKSYDPADSDGSIFVVGDSLSCYAAAKQLMKSDDRDNIDGLGESDGLPDFAGESISVVNDVANGLYDSLVLKGKGEVLREITVRTVLMSVDTLCYLSPFDLEGLGKKQKAKMIVLSSPAMAAYGLFDVDSLLMASSCSLPVISPVHTLAEEITEDDNPTVGVITSGLRADAGIYPMLFGKAAASKGKDVSCYAAPVDDPKKALMSFLDGYIGAGNVNPIDVIVVDDRACSIERMKKELETILSVMNEEFLKYSDFISPGFRIVEPSSVLRRECYRTLRERNLFTHRIAHPVTESYLIVSRDRGTNLDSDILIEYNNRYIPR